MHFLSFSCQLTSLFWESYNSIWSYISVSVFSSSGIRKDYFEIFTDNGNTIYMTKLSQHYHIYSTGIELNIVSSPHGVLHVVPVKGDEEAEDGEEHDGVGCENETTRSSCDLQSKLSH